MTWNDATAWVDAFVYAGLNDWRLPYSPVTAQGFINEGELGHLYYTTLGNPALGEEPDPSPAGARSRQSHCRHRVPGDLAIKDDEKRAGVTLERVSEHSRSALSS
jgi:hypothetical protein